MRSFSSILLVWVLLHAIAYKAIVLADHVELNTYLVHMDKSTMPILFKNHIHWYDSKLKSVALSAKMLYTYNEVLHGFCARLTENEAKLLQGQLGVISVQEEKVHRLLTTRTPLFLGLENSEKPFIPNPKAASNVIIGLLDTGIWPESKSFDDTGLGPVPSHWKGACEAGKNFTLSTCNKKLIGARFFNQGHMALVSENNMNEYIMSPRDDLGHGTHTSSIAAGSPINNVSLFGYAEGTARGIAPYARIAMYKVCWGTRCLDSDILAGMDKAIQDGVDILSVSIAGKRAEGYDLDPMSLGSFSAMSKGIFVSLAIGNSGPSLGSAINVAPWAISVGAGTIDRDFPAYLSLGNGKMYSGVSLSQRKPLPEYVRVIYDQQCTLDPSLISGKLVVCDRRIKIAREMGKYVREAGGLGVIITNTKEDGESLVAFPDLFLTVVVGHTAGEAIKAYATSATEIPTVKVEWGDTRLGIQPSPKVAFFSSRGPNKITPEILKPDVLAPGVDILGSWTGVQGPTGLKEDFRRVDLNIDSGTSMSCPHISGVAALIKAAHPGWSPAAIRSAIMTTAYDSYKNGNILKLDDFPKKFPTPYDYGAGHVNPVRALEPGLVYDATIEDYLPFLCAKYTSQQIKLIAKREFFCQPGKEYRVEDLNYPSFSVIFPPSPTEINSVVKFTRTLTNVGYPATYKATVSVRTQTVKVKVEPESLTFTELNQKMSFTVTFSSTSCLPDTTSSGRLVWSDGTHEVASSIGLWQLGSSPDMYIGLNNFFTGLLVLCYLIL